MLYNNLFFLIASLGYITDGLFHARRAIAPPFCINTIHPLNRHPCIGPSLPVLYSESTMSTLFTPGL